MKRLMPPSTCICVHVDLACFFLPSFPSLIKTCTCTCTLLMCFLYTSLTKYSVRGSVLLRHCSAEFMKHVLPGGEITRDY